MIPVLRIKEPVKLFLRNFKAIPRAVDSMDISFADLVSQDTDKTVDRSFIIFVIGPPDREKNLFTGQRQALILIKIIQHFIFSFGQA